MLRLLKLLATAGLLVAVVSACDRAPTEPAFAELEALLAAASLSHARPGSSNTLPALFREAIEVVEKRDGRRGVENLLARWRELQEALKAEAPTASRALVDARLTAIRTEELRIVRQVLGDVVLTRAVSDVNLDIAEARSQIAVAQAAGSDVSAAVTMVKQARERIGNASGALVLQDLDAALDQATQAAAQMVTLRYHLVELRRVAGLETLFPRAVDKLRAARGETGAEAVLATVNRLETEARETLRSGDRQQAHQSLERVRAEQIRIVQRVLGNGEAVRLVEQVQTRAAEVRTRLDSLSAAGRDVFKYERMLRQALDLNKRAAASLESGDSGAALDLGSHAAGLLNAVQHLTW